MGQDGKENNGKHRPSCRQGYMPSWTSQVFILQGVMRFRKHSVKRFETKQSVCEVTQLKCISNEMSNGMKG